MEENKKQNASLMVTTIDEDGKYHLSYIPLHVDEKLLDEILKNGQNENIEAISFDLDCDDGTFWKDMWKDLKGIS